METPRFRAVLRRLCVLRTTLEDLQKGPEVEEAGGIQSAYFIASSRDKTSESYGDA